MNLCFGGEQCDRQIWPRRRAFERLFGPAGRMFEQANFQNFKCRGGGGGGVGCPGVGMGMLKFQIDWRIVLLNSVRRVSTLVNSLPKLFDMLCYFLSPESPDCVGSLFESGRRM